MNITGASSAGRDSARNAPSAAVLIAVVALAVVCLGILVPKIWFVASMIVDHSKVGTSLSGLLAASSIFLFYMPIAFGVLGLCIAAGLLFLKEWARKAAIQLPIYVEVIYALLVIFRPAGVVSKPRPNWQLGVMTMGSGLDVALYVLLLAHLIPLSLWWLILFTRPGVRAQFQAGKDTRK